MPIVRYYEKTPNAHTKRGLHEMLSTLQLVRIQGGISGS
jgi:hypothetical protein